MYQIRVHVIHALGAFKGVLSLGKDSEADDVTYEMATAVIEELQLQVGRMQSLTLVLDDGGEISFTEKVLDESIFVFKIEELGI